MLLFKVFMTLGFTEPEHLAIVADEHHAVARVYGPQTEITLLNKHVECAWVPAIQTPSFSLLFARMEFSSFWGNVRFVLYIFSSIIEI